MKPIHEWVLVWVALLSSLLIVFVPKSSIFLVAFLVFGLLFSFSSRVSCRLVLFWIVSAFSLLLPSFAKSFWLFWFHKEAKAILLVAQFWSVGMISLMCASLVRIEPLIRSLMMLKLPSRIALSLLFGFNYLSSLPRRIKLMKAALLDSGAKATPFRLLFLMLYGASERAKVLNIALHNSHRQTLLPTEPKFTMSDYAWLIFLSLWLLLSVWISVGVFPDWNHKLWQFVCQFQVD